MILKALVELAESEGLTGDLDYQPVKVRWIVTLDADGKMLGDIADTQRPSDTGKGPPVVPARNVPNRSKRTSAVGAEFVVDKAGYVFGLLKEKDPNEKRAAEQVRV